MGGGKIVAWVPGSQTTSHHCILLEKRNPFVKTAVKSAEQQYGSDWTGKLANHTAISTLVILSQKLQADPPRLKLHSPSLGEAAAVTARPTHVVPQRACGVVCRGNRFSVADCARAKSHMLLVVLVCR